MRTVCSVEWTIVLYVAAGEGSSRQVASVREESDDTTDDMGDQDSDMYAQVHLGMACSKKLCWW